MYLRGPCFPSHHHLTLESPISTRRFGTWAFNPRASPVPDRDAARLELQTLRAYVVDFQGLLRSFHPFTRCTSSYSLSLPPRTPSTLCDSVPPVRLRLTPWLYLHFGAQFLPPLRHFTPLVFRLGGTALSFRVSALHRSCRPRTRTGLLAGVVWHSDA